MMKIVIAAAFAALGLGAIADAAPVINARQLNQDRRIDAGRRSGKLTYAEARRLKAEQRSIAALERRLKARHGGRLTAADRRLIHARQEAANRHILVQKHDAQRGPNKLKL